MKYSRRCAKALAMQTFQILDAPGSWIEPTFRTLSLGFSIFAAIDLCYLMKIF